MLGSMVRTLFTVLVYAFAAIGFFLVFGYFAVRFGLTNEAGIIDVQREAFLAGGAGAPAAPPAADRDAAVPWSRTEEWSVLDAAIRKDAGTLARAADAAGVPARLIAANLVTEQLRLFFTEREFYKQFFSPLKILGAQTQFSWGVMGMKEDTAIAVERHLKDPASPYYPGAAYERLLDFAATDDAAIKQERFYRMTDQHDHYWSYLYAGLYLKEIEAQWRNAGYPIDDQPAILATLFNIGFAHSAPNANPQVGGAQIDVGGVSYSFGGLAGAFYASGLLADVFPR